MLFTIGQLDPHHHLISFLPCTRFGDDAAPQDKSSKSLVENTEAVTSVYTSAFIFIRTADIVFNAIFYIGPHCGSIGEGNHRGL